MNLDVEADVGPPESCRGFIDSVRAAAYLWAVQQSSISPGRCERFQLLGSLISQDRRGQQLSGATMDMLTDLKPRLRIVDAIQPEQHCDADGQQPRCRPLQRVKYPDNSPVLKDDSVDSNPEIVPWDGPLPPPDGPGLEHSSQRRGASVAPAPAATIRAVHNRMQAEVTHLNDYIEDAESSIRTARGPGGPPHIAGVNARPPDSPDIQPPCSWCSCGRVLCPSFSW